MKDLMNDAPDSLPESELRIYVVALRAVVRGLRLDVARKETEICRHQLDAVSYRARLAKIGFDAAEAENRGVSP